MVKKASEKSYVTAVAISAVFGIIGIHQFYLGRWLMGCLDVGLFIVTITLFVLEYPIWGVALLIVDVIHSLVITILLLIGAYKDGKGCVVTYPGQQLANDA